jgi:rubrerythrin
MKLEGTKTHDNLKLAFAGESQTNRRYLYFANQADKDGYPQVARLFRDVAEGETDHAHSLLDFLRAAGDPATGMPIGQTKENVKAALTSETRAYADAYPNMAKIAREEGFAEIAELFEEMAKAEKWHAEYLRKALEGIS